MLQKSWGLNFSEGSTDGRTRMCYPCVLQCIVPFRAVAQKNVQKKAQTAWAGLSRASEGKTDDSTDIWKLPSVFYRKSSSMGLLLVEPKFLR